MDPDFTNTMDRLQRRTKDLREQMTSLKREIENRLRKDPDGLDRILALQERLVDLLEQYEATLQEFQTRLGISEDAVEDIFFDSVTCESNDTVIDNHREENYMGEVEKVPDDNGGKRLDDKELNEAENHEDGAEKYESSMDNEICEGENEISLEIINKILEAFHRNDGQNSTEYRSFDEIVNEITNALDKQGDDVETKKRLQEIVDDIVNKVNKNANNSLEEEYQNADQNMYDADECEDMFIMSECEEEYPESAIDQQQIIKGILSAIEIEGPEKDAIKEDQKNINENFNKKVLEERKNEMDKKLGAIKEKEVEVRNELKEAKKENDELQEEIKQMKSQQTSALGRSMNGDSLSLANLSKYEEELNRESARIQKILDKDSSDSEEEVEEIIDITDNNRYYNLHLFNNFTDLLGNKTDFVEKMRRHRCGNPQSNRDEKNKMINKNINANEPELKRGSMRREIDRLNKEYDAYVAENPDIIEKFAQRKGNLQTFGRKMQEIVKKELKCKKIKCEIRKCNKKLKGKGKNMKYVLKKCNETKKTK